MLKIVYPDARTFRHIIEALSKIVDEALMKITSEGVELKAMDPAHVSLLHLKFPPEAFEEYSVEGEYKIGFNTANILKLLKRGKKGDRLELSVEEDMFRIALIGAAIRAYKIRILDIPEAEIPEATLEFDVSASIISDPLKNALKDAEAVGDTVEFSAENEEELIIRGKGGEMETETRISRESGALISLNVKNAAKSEYSLEYIKNVIALTKVADTVTLEFSNNMPLKLDFAIPGEGRVIYLLAPKE
ncbi:MAG TPA: proliferating cell nuclear antigen (pcna) [Desulfurococcales archaeon]|nr:proliferating cell nuclear antigen (pcna) [Desulfurococcales archaeon]